MKDNRLVRDYLDRLDAELAAAILAPLAMVVYLALRLRRFAATV